MMLVETTAKSPGFALSTSVVPVPTAENPRFDCYTRTRFQRFRACRNKEQASILYALHGILRDAGLRRIALIVG
jgi:hypothetical protein